MNETDDPLTSQYTKKRKKKIVKRDDWYGILSRDKVNERHFFSLLFRKYQIWARPFYYEKLGHFSSQSPGQCYHRSDKCLLYNIIWTTVKYSDFNKVLMFVERRDSRSTNDKITTTDLNGAQTKKYTEKAHVDITTLFPQIRFCTL